VAGLHASSRCEPHGVARPAAMTRPHGTGFGRPGVEGRDRRAANPPSTRGSSLESPLSRVRHPTRRARLDGGPAGSRGGTWRMENWEWKMGDLRPVSLRPILHSPFSILSIPRPHALQAVRHHPDSGHRGHEVQVARPAGHDVGMEMLRQTGPGGVALIDPEVHAVGLEGPLDEVGPDLDQPPERGPFLGGVVEQPGLRDPEGGQKVTVRVGKPVQHEKSVLVAMNDQRPAIELGMRPRMGDEVREHRLFVTNLPPPLLELAEIRHSPGGPEGVVHGGDRDSRLEIGDWEAGYSAIRIVRIPPDHPARTPYDSASTISPPNLESPISNLDSAPP